MSNNLKIKNMTELAEKIEFVGEIVLYNERDEKVGELGAFGQMATLTLLPGWSIGVAHLSQVAMS